MHEVQPAAAAAHGPAAGLPVPPDRRGAHHALPRPEGRRSPVRRPRRRRGRPQQVRAMGLAIEGNDGGGGVVLLLREGPQVPDGAEDEQGHGVRVLEGDGQGQGDLQGQGPRRHEENARLPHGEGSPGRQDRLGHARVPPRGRARRSLRPPQGCHVQGRVGAVQGVQQELRAVVSGRQERRVHGDGGRRILHVHGGRRPRLVRAPSADGRVRRLQRRHHLTLRGGGGILRAAATGTRDLLLQRAGGPVPEPTVPPPLCSDDDHGTGRRRRGGSPYHGLCLAVLGEHADAVRAGRRRGGHGARAPGGRLVLQGREGEAERRLAGHRPHLGGEPRRDLLIAATRGSRGVLLGLLKS